MALSIAQWAQVSDWFSTGGNGTTKTVTGLSWSAGDMIVVIGGVENTQAGNAVITPTNANLTFGAALASSTSGGDNECAIFIYATTAASSQSSQTITSTLTLVTGVRASGAAVWVVTGAPTGTANAAANLTETAPSITVLAGSIVIYGLMDWNATNPPGKTALSGSGSSTIRLDQGNTTNYAQWLADWVGTAAGTFSFGPNNYTSLQVAQAIVEVRAPTDRATPGLWNSGVRRG